MNTKIEKIEKIEFEQLVELTQSIIKNKGYIKFERKNNKCLLATHKSPMTEEIHGFILFTEKFSGDIDIDFIKKEIAKFAEQYNFHSTIIINNNYISKGFKYKFSDINLSIKWIDRDELINYIDDTQPNYWHHQDIDLLEYEKIFIENIRNENDLKRLKIFEKKYDKLINIFIEPRIYQILEDRESNTPTFKKTDYQKIVNTNKSAILSGDAGSGKTTTLKKIGEFLISSNTKQEEKRKIPVFISATELIENNYVISEIVDNKLNTFFNIEFDKIVKSYDITILVDSIDEFDDLTKQSIISQLDNFNIKYKIRYILSTRHFNNNFNEYIIIPVNYYYIEKFNTEQMQKFLVKFFPNKNRANDLIDALKENRILERLPITPMTISLISVLFEEQNFEIPATISDIYDNFNLLLLGKANVKSRFEFINISFKERILSLYAYKIINTKNKLPLKKDKFFAFFEEYFENKTLPVEKEQLNDLLDFLITNTGILYLDEDRYVKFKHDSFMEYYTAIEIFKHNRDSEKLIIENFTDANWQNVAVFYAGKSRDMPNFLEKIIEKVKSATKMNSFFVNVSGIGYLLQALYQTDNILRKKAILVALETNIKAYENLLSLVADNKMLAFKNLSIPFVASINLMLFVENFNSITLKHPLELSFIDLIEDYKNNPDLTKGFKALKVALTLDSPRIKSNKALKDLIWETSLLKNTTLTVLADLGTSMYKGENYKAINREIQSKIQQLHFGNLLKLPARKLRFTEHDTIKSEKQIKLFTEGKTDSEIIEHAYKILTFNDMPYWTITSAGNESGGAHELSKLLMSSKPLIEDNQILIGIFDNDAKGIQEFKGLNNKVFDYFEGSKRIKKHNSKNIFAIKLPVPPNKQFYLKKQREMNFFAIEHYFSETLLNEHNMLIETDIPDIFKINDKKTAKTKFSKFIRTLSKNIEFEEFIYLFKEIDKITKFDIDYNY